MDRFNEKENEEYNVSINTEKAADCLKSSLKKAQKTVK